MPNDFTLSHTPVNCQSVQHQNMLRKDLFFWHNSSSFKLSCNTKVGICEFKSWLRTVLLSHIKAQRKSFGLRAPSKVCSLDRSHVEFPKHWGSTPSGGFNCLYFSPNVSMFLRPSDQPVDV